VLETHFLLLSMLKTVVLLNIFVETKIKKMSDSLMKKKIAAFILIFCIFTVTFN